MSVSVVSDEQVAPCMVAGLCCKARCVHDKTRKVLKADHASQDLSAERCRNSFEKNREEDSVIIEKETKPTRVER